MGNKLTSHIISITAFIIFIILGLACASAPDTVSQNFKPRMPLTQELMSFGDPRRPKGYSFSENGQIFHYLHGSLVPENFTGKLSFLSTRNLSGIIYIDKVLLADYIVKDFSYSSDSFIGLTPGNHSLTFTYEEQKYFGNDYVNINYRMTLEVDLQEGKYYEINCDTKPVNALESNRIQVHGYGKYNISFYPREMEKFDVVPTKAKTLKVGFMKDFDYKIKSKVIFLEPYDSNLPVESQCFIRLMDGLYVVGFDGETVSWGADKDYVVTIGIPAGKHEIQFANLDTKILHTITLDTFPQNLYRVNFYKKNVWVTNLNKSFESNESGKFTIPK